VLCIASLATPPFQKNCSNRRFTNIIILLTSDVHCNVRHSKPKDLKSGFLCATIPTNEKHMLLTIEGKWLKTIVHMIKFTFLALPHHKQVSLLVSIWICGKFYLLPTFNLVWNNF
jgi:mRNA-degrading endonuclease HigB of HigAB toxin-antitoxin module